MLLAPILDAVLLVPHQLPLGAACPRRSISHGARAGAPIAVAANRLVQSGTPRICLQRTSPRFPSRAPVVLRARLSPRLFPHRCGLPPVRMRCRSASQPRADLEAATVQRSRRTFHSSSRSCSCVRGVFVVLIDVGRDVRLRGSGSSGCCPSWSTGARKGRESGPAT